MHIYQSIEGLEELNSSQKIRVNGGYYFAALVGALTYICENWDDLHAG